MLRELRIDNFALIDHLHLHFEPGFTVLTGETGAGKSILIEALGAAIGERLPATVIRAGAEAARVEAVFEVPRTSKACHLLCQAGLEAEDLIVVTRTLTPQRSRYWINRAPVPQTLVQQVTAQLVDLHGQHEHQTLLEESTHLRFLDTFGGAELEAPRAAYRAVYEQLEAVRAELQAWRAAERDRAQRQELLTFQLNEIRAAALQPGEEEQLRQERARLQNLERLLAATATALQALGAEETGAVDLLALAAAQLSTAATWDPSLAELSQQIQQAAIMAAEARRSLQDYQHRLDFEPGRAEEVEGRLAELQRLKRKYGDSVEAILAYAEQAEAELQALANSNERIAALEQTMARLRQEAGQWAEKLSALRRQQAARLEQLVRRELAEVGMERAAFVVEFAAEPAPDGLPDSTGRTWAATADGFDRVRFLFSANPGEPPRPLSNIASGGELSRLMLVFKSLCARGAEIPTLVFDEIDVGIGGLTAHAVGRKLAALGRRAQVLCVTHLPQIACRGDHHLTVHKVARAGRTVVKVRPLTDAERLDELARMLGADRDQRAARLHAEQMLAEAARERTTAKVKAK